MLRPYFDEDKVRVFPLSIPTSRIQNSPTRSLQSVAKNLVKLITNEVKVCPTPHKRG